MTIPYFINALNSSYRWGEIGQARTLTYSFATSATGGERGFALYDETQKQAVRLALSKYSHVSGLKFVEVADSLNVQMRYFRDDLTSGNYGDAAGYAQYPTDGDVHIHSRYVNLTVSGFTLLLHETGHALGLKHSFSTPALTPVEDNQENTIMSYNGRFNSTDIKIFDIATIQYLYGVNHTARAGHDTYRISDRYIWDGAGIDTLSASGQTLAVYLDLRAGSWIYAGSKNSSILATNQAFVGYGTTLENVIGGNANDTLIGNQVDNVLDGQAGIDTMQGGLGNDIYYVDNFNDVVVETGNSLWDVVYSNVSYRLSANVYALFLTGTANINALGNSQNNYLVGNMGHNQLNAGLGDDILRGGQGIDTLIGGGGNDTYYVDNSNDIVVETGNSLWDAVYSNVSYRLSANVYALFLTGTANINALGNSQNNYLVGNAGSNIFDGGAGVDIMVGGLGDDHYNVYHNNSKTIENANQGFDTVYTPLNNYQLSEHIEGLVLTTGTAINGYGNAGHNKLTGNTANNLLHGNGGNDTLIGGEGLDTLTGGIGKDTYHLAETTAATDTVIIGAGESLATANSFDSVHGFKLGSNTLSTTGVDKLDLQTTLIAANVNNANGIDAGTVHTHSIQNGMITFDTAITASNLNDVMNYLKTNITGGNTVALISEGNTYVFQDNGVMDTLVELVGVSATSLSTTGLATGAVWLV